MLERAPGRVVYQIQVPDAHSAVAQRQIEPLLGRNQQLLRLPELTHVARGGKHACHLATAVAVDAGVVEYIGDFARAVPDRQRVAGHAAFGKRLPVARVCLRRVGKVAGKVAADQFGTAHPGRPDGGLVDVGDFACRVDGEQRVEAGFQQAARIECGRLRSLPQFQLGARLVARGLALVQPQQGRNQNAQTGHHAARNDRVDELRQALRIRFRLQQALAPGALRRVDGRAERLHQVLAVTDSTGLDADPATARVYHLAKPLQRFFGGRPDQAELRELGRAAGGGEA